MRHRGPENELIRHFEGRQERIPGQGQAAEKAVLLFFDKSLAGFEARKATPREDSGHIGQGVGSKMIDNVVYESRPEHEPTPSFVIQVTTSDSPEKREKKLEEMRDYPFVRLPEMNRQDIALPRALVYLDARAVRDFAKDNQFDNHPGLALQILDSVIKSLRYDLGQTKLASEQDHIKRILATLEAERIRWSEKMPKAA